MYFADGRQVQEVRVSAAEASSAERAGSARGGGRGSGPVPRPETRGQWARQRGRGRGPFGPYRRFYVLCETCEFISVPCLITWCMQIQEACASWVSLWAPFRSLFCRLSPGFDALSWCMFARSPTIMFSRWRGKHEPLVTLLCLCTCLVSPLIRTRTSSGKQT